MKMSTNAVVDVTTQYLMNFGPLLGDIKKRVFLPSILDKVPLGCYLFKGYFFFLQIQYFKND